MSELKSDIPTKVGGDGLPEQSLEALDVEKLHCLSPEVMARQATINIGTIGHVAHGKSTVVKAISGVHTVRFRTELERNITIKLGYANAKIYKCTNPKCPRPDCYTSYGSKKEVEPLCQRKGCGSKMKLMRHVSFVDCPGHDILMATMLNGAAVMDAALLLIAGNEPCPQPQTSEHLAAVESMQLKNIIILQNKVDLMREKQAAAQYEEILNFVRGTIADGAPIIPISAQLKYNIEVICEYICTHIPLPLRDFTSDPQLIVIRSFDVNKPGEKVENLLGGVAGGSIQQGVLRLGDAIEVRPGIVTRNADDSVHCTPIVSTIISLLADANHLAYAVPGGLIGVGTRMDPTLTRADRLVGQVVGLRGKLPPVFIELEISFFLLRRLLGVKQEQSQSSGGSSNKKKLVIQALSKGEFLMVNIGSTSTGAVVSSVAGDLAKLVLVTPVCCEEKEQLALSRRVDKHWRLIGWGKIQRGKAVKGFGKPGSDDEENLPETVSASLSAEAKEAAVDAAESSSSESEEEDKKKKKDKKKKDKKKKDKKKKDKKKKDKKKKDKKKKDKKSEDAE